MNNSRKLKLGVVPTRRNIEGEVFCNVGIAQAAKQAIERKLTALGIEFVNIDFLNPEGIIASGLDARVVADYMNKEQVDALFTPHVNFGTEDAVAKIGKWVKKPLLLWAPRDPAPDANGLRAQDAQCGLMATGKVLRQFGVPFTYMTNCHLEDETFERTMDAFLGAAQVAKAMRSPRIGQIGVRPDEFWSVKCNELQLLERFGVEVVPVTMIELKAAFDEIYGSHGDDLAPLVDDYKRAFDVRVAEDDLKRAAALKLAMAEWAERQQVSAIASNCWGPIRDLSGVASCFTFGELTNEGLPVVCETDVHGAITSVIAQAATRWRKASFFADITVRHPTNDNAELFWHCGVFPRSTASGACKPAICGNFDEGRAAVGNFLIEDSPVTLTRFDCSDDQYMLLIAEGRTVPGPYTQGTYGWIEFLDWPKIEHKVVTGPYIHHVAGVHEHVSEVLYEACKYIPGLMADLAEPEEAEVLKRLR